MKTDNLDLGQKVKNLNFSYEKMNSQTASLFYIWKVVWKLKEGGKKAENQEKKLQFFLFMRFYTGRRNVNNKKGLFYVKFFDLKSFSIIFFFVVASSLSTLWIKCVTETKNVFILLVQKS